MEKDIAFGVINSKTGDFVEARFDNDKGITPVNNEGRLGKIKDKKTLEKLNKMLQ